jgi:hypothetical protein
MGDDASKLGKGFTWWDPKPWKPQPPAHQTERDLAARRELPQGDKKWRLNNPKKRATP